LKLDRDKLIRAREMLGYAIETVAEEAGISKNSVLRAEHEEDIRPVTARKIAGALGVRVADLIREVETLKAQPPLPEFPDERRVAEPLPLKLRRQHAWMRRAELDRMHEHLTLRVETLREEAGERHAAGGSLGIFPLFLDAVLLLTGAETLLAQSRKEAHEIGGETKEERRLQSRLEHRIEDLEAARDMIGEMWNELVDTEAANKREEILRTKRATKPVEDEQPKIREVRGIFERRKAG
jgi:transcriptional regulator with XRE-family HTH domain